MSKKIIMIIIGAILGGISGYLYWNYIGCSTGSCAITSVWYKSTLYGMFMGGLLFDLIRDFLK
tara:strand:- start:987 stop:1175 length:189 start_codon:yes stop_codon:yes gene_type:complete